jgi:hypothetical protein
MNTVAGKWNTHFHIAIHLRAECPRATAIGHDRPAETGVASTRRFLQSSAVQQKKKHAPGSWLVIRGAS